MKRLFCSAALWLALAVPSGAADKKDDGFVPMFNGKDLTGWVNVNCAPGTFFVKNGEIITTGKPTGYLRTARQYENFIAEFDWMHVNKKAVGNSGFFVWADPLPAVGSPYTRAIEVQVLVNLEKPGYYTSQGDLFSIQGATCKPDRPHPHGWLRCLPSENRCKGGGEWNHYKVVANNGTIKLHVNGKEVSGLSRCLPRKGYLALESEGAECHFRNLKIKELPSTHPKPEEVAAKAEGFHNLYTGVDLSGWEANAEARKHWQPRDWVLHYDGQDNRARLSTMKVFGDAEFITDFRFPKTGVPNPFFITLRWDNDSKKPLVLLLTPGRKSQFEVLIGLTYSEGGKGSVDLRPTGQWNRLRVLLRGKSLSLTVNGKGIPPINIAGAVARGRLILHPRGEIDVANLFVRELKKETK